MSNSAPAALELMFMLNNGQKLKYIEPDRENAREFLKKVRPQKVFTETIHIAEYNNLTGIMPDSVSWIFFRTHESISWPYPSHLTGAKIITREEFTKAVPGEIDDIVENLNSDSQEKPVRLYWHLVMKEGTNFYFKVTSRTLIRMDKLQAPKVIAELSAFHATSDRGAVVVNMANVVSWTSYPPPLEFGPNTWELKHIP